jgi:hypothetical protein
MSFSKESNTPEKAITDKINSLERGNFPFPLPRGYKVVNPSGKTLLNGQYVRIDRTVTIDHEQAEYIKKVFEVFIQLKHVARTFEVIRSIFNFPNNKENIARILREQCYTNELTYRGVTYQLNIGQIIDKTTFAKASACFLSENRGQKTRVDGTHKYRSFIDCNTCRRQLHIYTKTPTSKTNFYLCKGHVTSGGLHARVCIEESIFDRQMDAVLEHLKVKCASILTYLPEQTEAYLNVTYALAILHKGIQSFEGKNVWLKAMFTRVSLLDGQVDFDLKEPFKSIYYSIEDRSLLGRLIFLTELSKTEPYLANVRDSYFILNNKQKQENFLRQDISDMNSIELLCMEPRSFEELLQYTALDLNDLQSQLIDLQLEGKIDEVNGKWRTIQ